LSGLANFRYFTRRLHEETRRAGRYRHLLSLLFLDLDHFKQFNDRHGHLAGNRALEHVAAVLQAEARETDLVARYGGEEFAVLMPDTAKHEAHALGERIRARLEQSPVELPQGEPQRLTVSLGLATYPRDAQSTETLLAAADQAMYASKSAGRNRITMYQPATAAHFEYVPEDPGAAQSITVAGDFNGWNKDVDPMQREASGRFSLGVKLAPGRYAYKFVINGEWYITDPASSRFAHDGYGGRNSVMVVEDRGVTGPSSR
ncbi:MAG: diguanylate cyclase, partial [Planctomycetota bacterium]|nr:diguanylate cyclase [Planctomycetota bacterium]